MKSWAQKVRSGVVGVVFVFYCLRVGGGGGPSDPIRSQFWALRPLAEGGPSGPLGQGAPDILSECPPLMAALVFIIYIVVKIFLYSSILLLYPQI